MATPAEPGTGSAEVAGEQPRGRMLTRRGARWIDTRLGAAKFARTALGKVFPDHWSFLIGEIALYSFVVLVLTGTYLTFFFDASTNDVVYHGSYAPLQGVHMTAAYRSAIDLSFDVRAGLVMRQIHHWAALLFLAAIVVHLMRIFFTGAFRKPREINWMIGVTLLILGIFNGFAGYSLLDDQLSGTGLRIAYSITLSIPVAGTWLASLLFGGEFPGPDIINRLYVHPHPAAPGGDRRAAHRPPGHPGAPEAHPVPRAGAHRGPTSWASGCGPASRSRRSASCCSPRRSCALLGGLAQINPIWLFGPFDPAEVSAASQPDWYMGWLDGALRLLPGWETAPVRVRDPHAVLPRSAAGRPHVRRCSTPGRSSKPGSPATAPTTTCSTGPATARCARALGVATLTFYAVLTLAASSDVTATTFDLSVNRVLLTFRILLFAAPVVLGWTTYRLCKELSRP